MRLMWIAGTGASRFDAQVSVLAEQPSASVRLRAGLPAKALGARGWEQSVLHGPMQYDSVAEARAWRPRLAILSKVLGTATTLEEAVGYAQAARALRSDGATVALDVSDNYFIDARAPAFERLLEAVDAVIANTEFMADEIRSRTGHTVQVIGDPVEGRRQPVAFDPPRHGHLARLMGGKAGPLRLFSFAGQERNFEAMLACVPSLARIASTSPVRIELLFVARPDFQAKVERLNAVHSPGVSITLNDWSREAMQAALDACHLVLIPGAAHDLARLSASPNRLLEGIWGGRFVVAHPVPSYWEFRECVWLGEDMAAGIGWALAHRGEVLRRIAKGQSMIEGCHTPEAIGALWHEVLVSMIRA